MKETQKRALSVIMAIVVFAATIFSPRFAGEGEVQAEPVQIADLAALQSVLAQCNNGDTVEVQLVGDITGLTAQLEQTAGSLILDLNGHTISGSVPSSGNNIPGYILKSSDGNLTILDSAQSGKIQNTNASGGVIGKNGGELDISGGYFQGMVEALALTGCTAKITGGSYFTEDADNGFSLHIYNNNQVTISGQDTSFTSYYGAVAITSEMTGNTLTVEDGTYTFRAKTDTSWGYACYIEGKTNLTVNGGTFINENGGTSLYIGAASTDAEVAISGGTYQGRIARTVTDAQKLNDYAWYGDGADNAGILADGYVLTDHASTVQENILFTSDSVKVVPGALIRLDTGRSTFETYTNEENAEADAADFHVVLPVSVGADGTIYPNSQGDTIPAVDTDRITDGNRYEFTGWYDESGEAYASVEAYVDKNGSVLRDTTLYAGWKAAVSAEAGLSAAISNEQAIRSIQLENDISLQASIQKEQTEFLAERTLDLGGYTISADYTATGGAALALDGSWKIGNGTITTQGQACLALSGTAELDALQCRTDDFAYAVTFDGTAENADYGIRSGTLQTTLQGSSVIQMTNAAGNSEIFTNLFQGAYASCTKTVTEGADVYLDTQKLYVLQTPVTYPLDGSGEAFGTYVYGDNIPAIDRTVSNQGYTGDITILDVTVDNPVFVAEGESSSKLLTAGGTDTYAYTVKVARHPAPGTYEGTVSVNYIRMDGEAGAYQHKVTLTITPKQLSIAEPALVLAKVYDGTAAAEILAGELSGVVSGDEVSVQAAAAYDSAKTGTGKTITVQYTLLGQDAGCYLAPVGGVYADGEIRRADGQAAIAIADYYVGQTAAPRATSDTNATDSVTWYYKQKNASDDTYTTVAPRAAGDYTLKAVLEENSNYKAVEKTVDFKVSYLAAPPQPYTLSGTKGSNGWYISGVTIYPPEGYLIATALNGVYQDSCEIGYSSEPVIYLQNAAGAITAPVQVEKILIDSAKPVISGIEDGRTYYSEEVKVRITDEQLETVALNGRPQLISGSSKELILTPAESTYVIVAQDKAGNSVTCRIGVEETWMREGITKNETRQLRRGKAYKLGSGQWTVKGDKTVYNGDMSFYVGNDEEYAFEKR